MPVHHKFSPVEKNLTITVSENFNFDLHANFRETYREITPAEVSTVTVNLNRATYMDSSALGMLLLLDEHFADIKINLEQCSAAIRSVLNIANFERKFNIS